MIDLIALSAAKKHADLLAMGLTFVSVDNTNKSITFTLTADGSQHTIYFDQPSDGVSIIGVEIKNGHLICLMSDGSEIDAGVLPSGSGSGGSGGGGSAVTTLHINVTAVNMETMKATFTADKTPAEMQQASVTGPIWCVVSFTEGTMAAEAVTIGVPPAWVPGSVAFGLVIWKTHDSDGTNKFSYFVARETSDTWILDLNAVSS